MTDLEQQMKAALDGKFFCLAQDGHTACRAVPHDFNGQFTSYQYGKKAVLQAAGMGRKYHKWTAGEEATLRYLRAHKTSIRQCAMAMQMPGVVVRHKCKRMGI